MGKIPLRRLWRDCRGQSVLEAAVAVFIVGTSVVGSVTIIGQSAINAQQGESSVTLLQLARAQIETIQQSPYQEDPDGYPVFAKIPDGFAVSWTSEDPGTTYTASDGTAISNVVQQITVKAEGDDAELSIIFCKISLE